MSLSRAEIEAMDEDELIAAIVQLSQTVDDQELRLEAMSKRQAHLDDRLNALSDENERLREVNDMLRDRVDETETIAEQAMSVAGNGHDPEARSKTEHAKALTRNVLIVRAANGAGRDKPVTVTDIQKRAQETAQPDLAWAIVDRAWRQLREDWPQFYETTKNGDKALSVRRGDVTAALVRKVELDLGRTDLAKQFVGGNGGDGA